ncbi:uncharacterized protein LOC110861314 [Folsomia candida]|uniref:uncharacterized protein LOC110861314 n=1 Tax=Folsomia candida TaxID=158441 RepID=UPI000B8FD2C8|nr:uncharacterized protein LOC110861314 [Folsomia candida]
MIKINVEVTHALKIFCSATFFIAIVIGTNAHVSCRLTRYWEDCQLNHSSISPRAAYWMEIVFIVFALLSFLGAILNFMWAWIWTPDRLLDAGCQALAGLLTLICGALMIAAVLHIDNKLNDPSLVTEWDKPIRRSQDYYTDKIAAGVFSFLASLLYFASAGVLLLRRGNDQDEK